MENVYPPPSRSTTSTIFDILPSADIPPANNARVPITPLASPYLGREKSADVTNVPDVIDSMSQRLKGSVAFHPYAKTTSFDTT